MSSHVDYIAEDQMSQDLLDRITLVFKKYDKTINQNPEVYWKIRHSINDYLTTFPGYMKQMILALDWESLDLWVLDKYDEITGCWIEDK